MELKLKAGEFYGTTSQSLSARGFRFTEKAYSSRARLPTHAHELSHFCFVLSGNYNENIGGRYFERRRMALVYYPPDVSHGEEHLTRGRHFLVEIDFNALEIVRNYGAGLREPVLLEADSLWLANRMYKEFNEPDEFSPVAVGAKLLRAREAGEGIKPGAQAPGNNFETRFEPAKWATAS